MILKNIKTEHTDPITGLVLKKITTSEGESFNRKIAVNNSIFSCEQGRLVYKKSLLNASFQINHIPFNIKNKSWSFDKMGFSKSHASKEKRFYLPFQQRNDKQWNNLTFAESETDFQDLATRGLSSVPYTIPIDSSLKEWKVRRKDAESILTKSQSLFPILCSKHKSDLFGQIFNHEFENSRLIGVQCYSLNDANTILNLMKIKSRNMLLQTGDQAPLLLGLSYEKILRKLSNVSGSFAYSCFGFDVLSYRQMFLENIPPDVIKKILSKKIEEIMRYDKTLGGFNLSAEQEFFDGRNLTQAFLEKVNLMEGLTPYQAIQWANYNEQQNDFDTLNEHILETSYKDKENSAINYIHSEKEKWSVFWKTKILQII